MSKSLFVCLMLLLTCSSRATSSYELELVSTLLANGDQYSQLKPNQLPKVLLGLKLPTQWNLIGHLAKKDNRTISYFRFPGDSAQSKLTLQDFLTSNRFNKIETEDPYAQGGFVKKGYKQTLPPSRLYCHSRLGFIEAYFAPLSNGSVIFVEHEPLVSANQSAQNCNFQSTAQPFFSGPALAETPIKLPILEVEDEAIVAFDYIDPYGNTMDTGDRWQSIIKIESSKTLTTLLEEMQLQLQQQGWQSNSQWNNQNSAGVIGHKTENNRRLLGELYITKLSDKIVEMTIAARFIR